MTYKPVKQHQTAQYAPPRRGRGLLMVESIGNPSPGRITLPPVWIGSDDQPHLSGKVLRMWWTAYHSAG